MDIIKAQFDRIQQQLKGLSASQKMLTASLLAIMVMTLVLWGRYAGEPEMMPLLDQPMTTEDLARLPDHLQAKGITTRIVGDRIFVATEQHRAALAVLTYDRMLPKNTSYAFDKFLGKMTMFDPPDKQKAIWNEAKQAQLSSIISALEGVADATVIIDGGQQRGIRTRQEPRASINITMRPGYKPTQHLANAAADLVAGAQQGLKPSEIRIVIDSRPFKPYDPDSEFTFGNGGELFEQLVQREQYYSQKIQSMIDHIPGAIVSVHCKINNQVKHSTAHIVDKSQTVQLEQRILTETEEMSSSEPAAMEPGAVPNTGMVIEEAVARGPETTSNREKSEIENLADYTRRDEVVKDPGGDVSVLGVSVRLPRSHFVNVYRARYGTDTEPEEKALEALMNEEVAHVESAVRALTGLSGDEGVSISLFTDILPKMEDLPQMAATTSLPLGLGDHAKEIAIGVLAVVSLFMVLMMVRKSTPAPSMPVAVEPAQPQQLAGGEDLAGEVGEGNPLLDGMELDDDAVRAQQMIGQVSSMVKENPDAAAQLVKRWLNRA